MSTIPLKRLPRPAGLFAALLAACAVSSSCRVAGPVGPAKPITPSETIHLFDGKGLDAFTTWLEGPHGTTDPDRVFSVVEVDGAPAIRSSGEHFGGLITKGCYENYRLVLEYRWGTATWGNRKSAARDNGVLLHCQGPPGAVAKDFRGPWMRSVELQIIEGGVGDLLLVPGYEPDGTQVKPRVTARVKKDRDGEWVFDPQGEAREIEAFARINWWGRDVDWEDRLGFRGKEDLDGPAGEWTRVEAVCDGDSLEYFVNGKLANAATRSTQSHGRLFFQSEGAEIFIRRIDLEPLRQQPGR